MTGHRRPTQQAHRRSSRRSVAATGRGTGGCAQAGVVECECGEDLLVGLADGARAGRGHRARGKCDQSLAAGRQVG